VKPDEVVRATKQAKRKRLEDLFAAQLHALKRLAPQREYRFHPTRKWRFDFAWPQQMVAVEVDGGEWMRGHHWRPKGVASDREKDIAADRLGWTVLHFTGSQVECGAALITTCELLDRSAVR
jgi:very-short-patch-repair endonuclease